MSDLHSRVLAEFFLDRGTVEIVETRSVRWMLRCHCCDLTVTGLMRSEADHQAREHVETREHQERRNG